MKLPEFLVIGAAKAGTSAFYKYLEQHPQVYASPIKEPHFFGLEGESFVIKGFADIEPWDDNSIRSFHDYCSLFKDVPSEAVAFEASTSYLYMPQAPERIKHYLPNVKLIAMLRNPVERAYSSFLYLMRNNREPLKDFSLALEAESDRIQDNWDWLYRYKDVGLYSAQIERYLKLFDANQIKFFLYDDFVTMPLYILREAYLFLGLDSSFEPDVSRKFNVSGIPKNKVAHQVVNNKSFLKSAIKAFLPQKIRFELKEFYYNTNLSKPLLSDDLRSGLIGSFKLDILKTQDLINRDLSNWLSPAERF